MALGKKDRVDGKAYSLKLKLKDGATFLDVPVFDVQEKQGDKYVSIKQVTDVDGDLFRISTRLGNFEGSPIRNVSLGLKDTKTNEAYFVEFGLGSGLGRGLANSILNLKAFNNVQIGLYGQTKADKTYPAVSVRQGDAEETVKWAYDPKAGVIPAVRVFKGKGNKDEKDYTAVEEFLFEKIAELGKSLEGGSAKPTVTPVAKPAVQAQEEGDDQPPF